MVLFEETQKIKRKWQLISIFLLVICTWMTLWVDRAFFGSVIVFGIFSVILRVLKLEIRIQEDRIEYRLFLYHRSYKVIMFDEIRSIDQLTSRQIGVYGFKIKHTPTSSVYYFGDCNLLRISRYSGKNLIIGIRNDEVMMFLNERSLVAKN